MRKKLKGTTIPEVLVAIGLTGLVFGMASMVWLSLSDTHSPNFQVMARMHSRNLLLDAEVNPKDFSLKLGGMEFRRELTPLNAPQGLFLVEVECRVGERLIHQRRKAIHVVAAP